jgi:hypothetical protein
MASPIRCGKQALDMKLRGRLTNADFGFDPIGLLKGLCGVLLGCTRHDEGARTTLIGCLATHDDLEITVLRKLVMIVTRDHMLPLSEQQRLAALVEAVAEEACRHGAAVGGAVAVGGGKAAANGCGADTTAGAPGAPAETSIFAVLEREIGVLGSEIGVLGSELGVLGSEIGEIGPSGSASGSAAASEGVEEEAAYVAALEGFVFDQADLLSDRAPQRHHYADQAAAAEGGGALPALRKKLMKEVRAPG